MTLDGFLTIDGERKAVTLEIPALNPQEGEPVIALPQADIIAHLNELTFRQHPDFVDPAGIGFVGNGLSYGHLSGSQARADGGREMSTLMQFKKDERTRNDPHRHGGEITIHCRDGDIEQRGREDGMRLSALFRPGYLYAKRIVVDEIVAARAWLRGVEV
jgi:hypothetical protein